MLMSVYGTRTFLPTSRPLERRDAELQSLLSVRHLDFRRLHGGRLARLGSMGTPCREVQALSANTSVMDPGYRSVHSPVASLSLLFARSRDEGYS